MPFLGERKKEVVKPRGRICWEAGTKCDGVGWGGVRGNAAVHGHGVLRQVPSRFGRQCDIVVIHLLSEVSLVGFKSHLSNSSAVDLGQAA